MKRSTHSLRKNRVKVFLDWTNNTNASLQRGILLCLTALTVTLGGCTLPPKISGESRLGVTPRKFESVVLTLNTGVFENLQTFDKIHIEHLGDVISQALKGKGVKTDVVLIRQTDLNSSAFHKAVQGLQPSHIVRITPTKRTLSTNLDMVTWAVQVDQQDPSKGDSGYVAGFKFTVVGDGCFMYKTWSSLEKELNCFRELSTPILSALSNKGF